MLKLLKDNLKINKCDGKRTIYQAKDVFTGYIDSSFKNWGLDKKDSETPETNVSVYEMTKDATFKDVFESLSTNLDSLCLNQDQIISFVEKHKDWLHPEGWETFFLFKTSNEFFVADVYRRAGRLEVGVRRFENASCWYAEYRYRVVVPQLSLNNLESNLDSSELCESCKLIKKCKKCGVELKL